MGKDIQSKAPFGVRLCVLLQGAAPAAPGAAANGVTVVLPDQRNDVGRLATRLGHGEQFASSGMAVATKQRPTGSGNRRRR